jgi:N-glycosidase YbiA
MKPKEQIFKTYYSSKSCVFRKTQEVYGGLSNMASGFPLEIAGVKILTSEALYQACRFPHLPEVQEKIIQQKSPMTAKMVGKPFRNDTREDWDEVRIKIMRWCLRIKLAQNFPKFGTLLESTFDKPIVEDSLKDNFWGAIRNKENNEILQGVNALGRLLMELRQSYNLQRYSSELFVIEPVEIPNFKLLDKDISIIDERNNFLKSLTESLKSENSNPFTTPKKVAKLNGEKLLQNEEQKNKASKKSKKDKFEGQGLLPF